MAAGVFPAELSPEFSKSEIRQNPRARVRILVSADALASTLFSCAEFMAIKRLKRLNLREVWGAGNCLPSRTQLRTSCGAPCESVCEPLKSAGSGPSANESARNWVRVLSVSGLDTDTGMARKNCADDSTTLVRNPRWLDFQAESVEISPIFLRLYLDNYRTDFNQTCARK